MAKSNIAKFREGVLSSVIDVSQNNLRQYKEYLLDYFRSSITSLKDGPSRRGIQSWAEEAVHEMEIEDPVVYIPVKGVSPLMPSTDVSATNGMVSLHHALPDFLKRNATAEITRRNLKSIMAARSFNVLLHLLNRGGIYPFAQDKKVNPIRYNFERHVARISGFDVPIASPIYGVISHTRSGKIDYEDVERKIDGYSRAVTLVLNKDFIDISTATLNDSTVGGNFKQ